MKKYKKIGIVGGISPQSSALFYKTIIEKHYQKFNDFYYPEIIMFSVNFGELKDYQKKPDTTDYIQVFVKAIESLQKSGADFAVIASNTPHRVLPEIKKKITLPILSIVDVIADCSVNKGFNELLLLGTEYTMREDFYKNGLRQKGIDTIVPLEDEQKIVNDIIFKELVIDIINPESKKKLIQIIEKYMYDAVILGCTELPLIIKDSDVKIPVINTTDVFAEATLNFASL